MSDIKGGKQYSDLFEAGNGTDTSIRIYIFMAVQLANDLFTFQIFMSS